jgi:site-specific recombinase XerD
MNKKITLHFYAKKTKANSAGLLPIYIRLTVDGQRLEFSTKKFIEKNKWSDELSKMKGSSEEARSINNYLDSIKAQVIDIQMTLTHKREVLNIENFRKHLFNESDAQRMLIPIYKEHNDKIESLIGNGYAKGTHERFEISKKHLEEFLLWKFNINDIAIDKINFALISDFDFYLRSEKDCNNNTAVKYVRNFRKVVKICLKNEWLEKDPFINYEGKMKAVQTDFLIHDQVSVIYAKKFRSIRLQLVADIFVFWCYTGLAYIDLKECGQEHIRIGIDGRRWIFKNRQKTGTISKIPLLPIAEEILAKYADNPQVVNKGMILPLLSNQKMNAYLKEVGDLCDIGIDLTCHLARHTFATTMLNLGVPIETVAAMLGHKNIQTTQHYARLLDQKVTDDITILREKLNALQEFAIPA